MAEPRATGHPPVLELVVAGDPVACAAGWLADRIRRLAARPGAAEIRLAIPGGSALVAVARAASALGPLWHRVALTWVDERCVPAAHMASNRGAAMRLGLLPGAEKTIGAAPARVLPLFEDGETPQAAIARVEGRYAGELAGGLDVVVLGMGEDGHVASLFPDRAPTGPGNVAFVSDSPKPPARRITLTREALASATHTLLVATGESKRAALARLRDGDPRLPATGLPGLVVVTDLELGPAEASVDAGEESCR